MDSDPNSKPKVKLVLISDTHTLYKDLTIPDGDVLIHTGDFCWKGVKEHIEEFNFSNTIKNFILDMFCVACTLLNNKFILSKIIYFESYSHLEKKILENKTKKFNYILEILNNKTFDLKKLYLELLPHDSEGELYNYSEFIKLLYSFE